MNLKKLIVNTAGCALLLLARSAFADTLKLVSVGGENAGGVYVYPYNFSVDGAKNTTSLMCLDYNRQIGFGEQWNVSIHGLSLGSDQTSIDYRAEAYLFSMLGGSTDAAAIQFAAWEIFDPAVKYAAGWQSGDLSLVTTALSKATNAGLIGSGFFSQFQLYTPLTDAASKSAWGKLGEPQEFIGRVAATPEPSSMMLLGTGLLASGFLLRRRKANTSPSSKTSTSIA